MRHLNDTAADTGWSAVASRRLGGFDIPVGDTPTWALFLGVCIAASTALAVVWFTLKAAGRSWARSRDRRAEARRAAGLPPSGLAKVGAQAVGALGGVAISVYGLWGFATEQADLPVVLCVGFIAIFDATELTLFWMLHREADERHEQGWSTGMVRMRNMAWTLVAFSAAMNFVHAGQWYAKFILAAIPVFAAKLIELQVDTKLKGDKPDTLAGKPGPVRLLVLAWQHIWSGVFAWFGFDAGSTHAAIARTARSERAAMAVYELRMALASVDAAKGQHPGRGRRKHGPSQKELDKLRREAQRAINRAELATDSAQALDVARRFTGMSRIDDLARVEVEQPTEMVGLLQDIAVMPSVARLEADVLLAEAEAARRTAEAETAALREEAHQEVETARKTAEVARQEVDAARQETKTARQEAETARQEAEEARRAAQDEAAALREGARRDAESSAAARQEVDAARQETKTARQEAETARERLRAAEHEAAELLRAKQEELARLVAEADGLGRRNAAARLLLDRQRGELATALDIDDDTDATGAANFKTTGKQLGWELYRASMLSEAPTEPSAKDLAAAGGVTEGRARAWLSEFSTRLGREMALTVPAQAARVTEHDRATEQIDRATASPNGTRPAP